MKTNFQVAMVHTKMLDHKQACYGTFHSNPSNFNLNGETLSIERISPLVLKIGGKGTKCEICKNVKLVISISVFACVGWVASDSTSLKETKCTYGLL